MKRFFSLLITAIILCTPLCPTTAFSAQPKRYVQMIPPTYENNSGPSYEALRKFTDMDVFRGYLEKNLKKCVEEINISSFGIPVSAANTLGIYIYKEIPEAFHVAGLSYSMYSENGNVLSLFPTYSASKSEYDALLAQCRQTADQMLAGLDDPALTNVEKALLLHDRLALHNQYDYTYQASYTYEMVGALVYRTSVCEGYAMAYSYLLDLAGFRNYYVSSELLSHGWNMVNIDGSYYHVDVTWDDRDDLSGVYHDNFLRSTTGMLESGHHKNGSYDFGNVAQDTRYDNGFWRCSDTAFQLLGGSIYYMDCADYSEIKLMKALPGEDEILQSLGSEWKGSPTLSSDGQDLLYSVQDKIYRYCPKTASSELLYDLELSSGRFFEGFLYDSGALHIKIYDSNDVDGDSYSSFQLTHTIHTHSHFHTYDNACDPGCNTCGEQRPVAHDYSFKGWNDECHWLKCSVCGKVDEASRNSHIFDNACDTTCGACGWERSASEHQYDGEEDMICNACGYERTVYAMGDSDGNGRVDKDDAVYLLYHVVFPEIYKIDSAADFDSNGRVEFADAFYLLYHVNFPDLYLLQ